MRVRSRIFAVFLILLLLPALPTQILPQPVAHITVEPAHGAVPGVKSFLIIISRDGFNGTHSADVEIFVNEGDRVQITFIMSEEERKDRSPENRHVMEITGYDIITETINADNPETTVVFLADKPGTFTIRCSSETWDCPGHEFLQDGEFKVRASAPPPEEEPATEEPAPPTEEEPKTEEPEPPPEEIPDETPTAPEPSPVPTILALEAQTHSHYTLQAKLTDVEGIPILGMPIIFTVSTTFGLLRLGSPYTDRDGVATVADTVTRQGTVVFTASFPGGGGYEASTAQVILTLPVLGEHPVPLLTARSITGVIAVIIGVMIWGVYLAAVRQIHGISRTEKKLWGDKQRSE